MNPISKYTENLNEVQKHVLEFSKNIDYLENGTCDYNKFQYLIASVKYLRNLCCKGFEHQSEILKILPKILSLVDIIESNVFENEDFIQKQELYKLVWQLIANLTVNNIPAQHTIWETFGNKLQRYLHELSPWTDIQLMILYNITKGKSVPLDQKTIFEVLLKIWSNILNSKEYTNLDFLHIFFEDYLCNISRLILPIYNKLESEERITTLKYIASYIQSGSPNGQIQKILMEYISKEFKKKSDCILRVNDEKLDKLHPYEVLILIEVISIASGDQLYSYVYENDHSLFLNAGGLLHTINQIGKTSNNVFTPMEKLIEVAPNSKINTSFESEVSFQLRTFLVRTLANLLYKNKKNQEYVRELNIISAILDSTRADARNPLIKEWSILAIRNLCENCPENQEIIRNLAKVGEASNDVLTELNLEMGSLRISPKN